MTWNKPFRVRQRERRLVSRGWRLLISLLLFEAQIAVAQGPEDGSSGEGSVIRTFPGGEPWPSELLGAPALPEPSGSQSVWLTKGEVKFRFYDSTKFPRRYQGETQFVARYSNDVRYRWKVRRDRLGVHRLSIFPEFEKIEFDVEHEVLLPIDLADANFFSHPLVLHELDHVRISSDPRFAATFREWMKKELREIVVEVQPPVDGNYRELAIAEVSRQTEALFQRLLQLIKVRYQELDRETKHGTVPLAANFFGEDSSADR